MKGVLLVLVSLVLCSTPVLAGEYIINDARMAAYGLRVTFTEPVTITGFGDFLMTVEPSGESDTFTFSGGKIEPGGGQWLSWDPESARISKYSWIFLSPDRSTQTLTSTRTEIDGYQSIIISSPQWFDGGRITFSLDGATLFVPRYGGVDCIDTQTWSANGTFDAPDFSPAFLTVYPVGDYLLTGGMLKRWSSRGQWSESIVYWSLTQAGSSYKMATVGEGISALTSSRNGLIACGTFPGQVWLFRSKDDNHPARIGQRNSVVDSLAFSSDGSLLAALYRGISHHTNCIKIYRVTDGTPIHTIIKKDRPYEILRSVTFSSDGRFLVVGGASDGEATIWIWRVEDWSLEARLQPSLPGYVDYVYFDGVSNSIVSLVSEFDYSKDYFYSSVVSWNGPNWEDAVIVRLPPLNSLDNWGPSLAVSPNDKYIACRIGDHVIVLSTDQLF